MAFTAAQLSVATAQVPGAVKVDGVTIGITPGGLLYSLGGTAPPDIAPAIPAPFANAGIGIATAVNLGIVRPDGISILLSPNGVLYAAGAPVPPPPATPLPVLYANAGLTAATQADLGIVWVDGFSILVDGNGTLSLNPASNFFDCTIGGKQSNSYICTDEAILLLKALPTSPGITDWLSLSGVEQQQSLIASTAVLDALNWAGCICNCEQRLQWPRRQMMCLCGDDCSTIPHEIKLATAYMAAFMGAQGGFIGLESTAGGSTGGGGVGGLEPFSEVTVGPIKVKMKEGITYGDTLATNIGQIPPFVADLIRRYLNAFGMSQGFMGRRSIARSWGTYIGGPAYTGSMYLRGGKVYPRVGGWASDMEGRRC